MGRLDRLGLREVPEKSRYLGPYRYYLLSNPNQQTAYQLQSALLQLAACVRGCCIFVDRLSQCFHTYIEKTAVAKVNYLANQESLATLGGFSYHQFTSSRKEVTETESTI